MGRPRKTPLNGDSKLIYDAISEVRSIQSECQRCLATLQTDMATETATRIEQHASNLRALETMSGDMHIVLSKVQNLDCKAHLEKMSGLGKNITWLWTIVSGTALLVVGAFIKHVLG